MRGEVNDLLLVIVLVVFFGACMGYVALCDRLMK